MDNHFKNVTKFYQDSFDHIKLLPSFHIGYDFATTKLEGMALKYGLNKCKNLLELCCGTGTSIIYLTDKYKFDALGVDITEKNIRELRKRINEKGLNAKLSVLCTNISELPAEIGKFDIVWSEDSLSHIPDKEKLFKACNQLLNTDGLLVFSDLIRTDFISEIELEMLYKCFNLWPLETIMSYQKVLENAFFDICETKTDLGNILVSEHIKINKKLKVGREFFPDYIIENRIILEKKWGTDAYLINLQRSKVYTHLKENKLDYGFFVAKKRDTSYTT